MGLARLAQCSSLNHWRQTKLYSEAIELVCGGSPIGCVLVERKAQHRGKWEKQQHRTSLDQLQVQHKCTAKAGMNGNYLQLPFSSLQGPSSLEVHQIRRAANGEPTLLE